MPCEIILLIASAIIGVAVGYIHAKLGKEYNPVWPIKLYLSLFRQSIGFFRKYADKRHSFQFREQFMAAAFVWFFIIFIISLMVFTAIRGYL